MPDPIRIALIDDDPAVLDSLRLYFVRQKIETSCFDTAEGFLAAVGRAESFDCVVSDVRMPGNTILSRAANISIKSLPSTRNTLGAFRARTRRPILIRLPRSAQHLPLLRKHAAAGYLPGTSRSMSPVGAASVAKAQAS